MNIRFDLFDVCVCLCVRVRASVYARVCVRQKLFATKLFAIRAPRSRTEPIDSRNAL